jgi:dTDP-4-dehydrorhamnose reductase
MRILVTGAAGMLGQDVVRSAREAGHEPIALARAELDIVDRRAVVAAIKTVAPDAIVNCAAWTDVDGAESDRDAAAAINASGAGNVAAAAAAVGTRLVHVSTDYVFDGAKTGPYVESDPTGPCSVYGATKLAGEQAIGEAGGSHVIARSSWLFGIGGRNFVETMLGLGATRDEVTVVTDQVGCPTFTGHLAPALIELAASEGEGVRHVAGDGACSWYDFAIEIFRRADVDCRVLPGTSETLNRPAPRPANSVLASERPDTPVLPSWQTGLDAYLGARAVSAR